MSRNRKGVQEASKYSDQEVWDNGEIIFQMEPCAFDDMAFLTELIKQKSGQPIAWRVWDNKYETYFEARTTGDIKRVLSTGESRDIEDVFIVIHTRTTLHQIFQGDLGPSICQT